MPKTQSVFVHFAKESADKQKITGWIRNLPNGDVELVAEGEENNLEKFASEIRAGPKDARIRNVKISYSDATGEFEMFEIR